MAKKIKKSAPPPFVKQASGAGDKVAKGKLSPKQADKLKHSPDAVLGKHDCSYHNC